MVLGSESLALCTYPTALISLFPWNAMQCNAMQCDVSVKQHFQPIIITRHLGEKKPVTHGLSSSRMPEKIVGILHPNPQLISLHFRCFTISPSLPLSLLEEAREPASPIGMIHVCHVWKNAPELPMLMQVSNLRPA